ncbi:Fic family protein [Mucilaginibacter polytrichastri]|nr:Fic family protein [Mucilaginibacter polytrichastri]
MILLHRYSYFYIYKMNLDLEIEFSKADIIKDVESLKNQIDAMRPLPADVEGRVMQKLRLDWNYNSNAIEGNKLNYGETTALLMHGITAKGKPLKDHLDIQGHNEAINYLIGLVKDPRPITETDIRTLHEIILGEPKVIQAETTEGLPTTKTMIVGDYKKLPNHVRTKTGEIHYYATPEEVPAKMEELMNWYYEALNNSQINPVVVSALFHHKFVAIHPFDDGNGRMARILMNLILMRSGYPVTVIKTDNKDNYYALLSRADVGDNWPFIEYIVERAKNSLQLYLKAARGGDIDEDEDIDKEIALFKMELKNEITLKEKKTKDIVIKVITNELFPLIESIITKEKKISEFFFSSSFQIRIYYKADSKDQYEYDSYPFADSFIKKLDQSYSKLEFESRYIEFKDDKNSFNSILKVYFEFDTYHYRFNVEQESNMINKLYHESFSIEEKNLITKVIINNIQKLIKDSLTKKA